MKWRLSKLNSCKKIELQTIIEKRLERFQNSDTGLSIINEEFKLPYGFEKEYEINSGKEPYFIENYTKIKMVDPFPNDPNGGIYTSSEFDFE